MANPVEEELQHILDSLPAEQPRSRLEAYRDVILRLRRQGRPYRRVAQILAEKFGVRAGTMTVHDFIRRRSRPSAKLSPEEVKLSAGTLEESALRLQAAAHSTRLSPAEIEAAHARIRAVKSAPASSSTEPRRFNYDPDQPLFLELPKEK
jgi:hypothetical protein